MLLLTKINLDDIGVIHYHLRSSLRYFLTVMHHNHLLAEIGHGSHNMLNQQYGGSVLIYYISDIKPGTKTGVMMFNSVEFCVTFLALTKLGAVVIPLPSKYSRNEVLSLTAKADLQYILCDEKFYDWFVPLETSGVHLMKPGRGKNGFGFSHLCASYLSPVPSLGREEDDALIMFTSGTTSQSKGGIIKNYSIMHAIVSYQRIFQITDRDSTLIPIPIYLVTGLVALLGLTLYAGGTVYLHNFLDAKRVLRDVNDKEITFLHSTPLHSTPHPLYFPCC